MWQVVPIRACDPLVMRQIKGIGTQGVMETIHLVFASAQKVQPVMYETRLIGMDCWPQLLPMLLVQVVQVAMDDGKGYQLKD